MIPLSRLQLLPWPEHAPGSLVFGQTYHGACCALRVAVPLAGAEMTPGLLLLTDAPWNSGGPSDKADGPGHVISAGKDNPFEQQSFGIPASELELEFDPQSLVLPGRVTGGRLGTLSFRRNGRPAILGGEHGFSRRWQRPFDLLDGTPLPESERQAAVAYSPAWELTLALPEGRIWRLRVAVPLGGD